MPKLDITNNEQTLLAQALDQAISSAQRQQNMKGKTPQMMEVYLQHERLLRDLQAKLMHAK